MCQSDGNTNKSSASTEMKLIELVRGKAISKPSDHAITAMMNLGLCFEQLEPMDYGLFILRVVVFVC